MRVLIVVGAYYLGGAEFHAFKLAKYFQQSGHKVEFWVFREGDGTTKSMCDEAGIKTRIITEFNAFLKGGSGYIQKRHYKKIVKSFNPDAIISFNYGPNVWNGIIGKLSKVPCLIWSQQSEFKEGWDFNLSKVASNNISVFLSNAKHVSDKLRERLPVKRPEHDFKVVYNGIEEPIIKNGPEFWQDKFKEFDYTHVVTMVANLTQTKDHLTLLKSWCLVLKSVNEKVKPLLVLAGRKGNTHEEVEDWIKKLEISSSVFVLGPTDDVAGLNNVSHIGVLSSKAEGLPNSVMEQMAMGLPIVGTANDGTKEAVGEVMWEYLSGIEDSENLARNISLFLNDEDLRAKIGKINKERVENYFTVEKMGEGTLSIIKQSLK